MAALRRFPLNRPDLSSEEKKVLAKLIRAAELLAPLYLKQKNPSRPGANFYPADASREEIEQTAKRYPEILSPYTFVERDSSGELVAVPYRVKFKKELSSIAKLLREAAQITRDANLKAYLQARAEDLLIDNYDRSNVLWLKTAKSKIGFVIGPFDRYIDKLFFQKRAYASWVGILAEDENRDMGRFATTFLASERRYLPGAKRVKVPEIKIRVEDTFAFSGLTADFLFTGNTLPSSADLHIVKKHGSIFTLFKTDIHLRFSEWLYPIFQNFFSADIQKQYSKEELELAFLKASVVHHASHSLMRYDDVASRLSEYFPYFDELYADLLGVKGCGTLLLKGAFTNRELEKLILITICHSFYFYGAMRKMPYLEQYAQGHAILLNFLLEGEALKKNKKGYKIDFHRAFMAMNQLAYIVEYYMALGNRSEAREFLKKFPIRKTFEGFNKYIPKDSV